MRKILLLVIIFLSGSVFANSLLFKVNGNMYEAAKSDLPGTYTWDEALTECSNLNIEGKEDWFLPSKDQLSKMYLTLSNIGGFKTDAYENFLYMITGVYTGSSYISSDKWDDSDEEVQSLDFSNGIGYVGSKGIKHYVRCVRIFSN